MGRIVVGIDGSTGSAQALAWSVEEARRRDDQLTVVHAYAPPKARSPYAAGYAYSTQTVTRDMIAAEHRWHAEQHDRARQRAESLVARTLRAVPDAGRGVPIRTLVVEDDQPARALVDAARNADLLVVGSRGLGAVKGRLLGSVSQQCAREARCPVVIVSERAGSRTPQPVTA